MGKKLIHLICVTYQNYGSLLQAYALQEAVINLGYNAEIVNYKESLLNKLCRLINKDYSRTRFRMLLKKIRFQIKGGLFKNKLRTRSCVFLDFRNKHLILGKPYTSLKDITRDSTEWDVVLLGSDQVWHPINYEMHFFTLEYISPLTRKYAYAPSFGVSSVPDKYKNKYSVFLRNFTALSSRENSGVDLIKKISGKEALLVCDPTLLLTADHWKKVLPNFCVTKESYLFVYLIGNNVNHRVVARNYACKNKLKIIALTHIDEYVGSDEGYADFTPFNVGPLEFLSLISNAYAVFTDSFHASVFSLLFHKTFFTFNRFESGVGASTTNRIESLLSLAGVRERRIKDKATLSDLLTLKEIDWDEVDNNIALFREKSIDYLRTILSE